MSEPLDALEQRIAELRAEVRRAVKARDTSLARLLRADLRRAERAWDEAVVTEEAGKPAEEAGPALRESGAALMPIREQVHQALLLLGVPTAAKLVVAVNEAFFAGGLRSPQLSSLRRDEERSFRSDPYARPYYLCAALTDRLSPARGLLADSTWPLEVRVVGPLSPRVDFLTTAVRIAEHLTRLAEPPPGAVRLLSRMAQNIPGAVEGGFGPADPATVVGAARAELEVHLPADTAQRAEVAARAGDQLTDVERLFGAAALSTLRGAC
ncbi:hypothetical protein Ppa06_52480 [Planomonospora parontospora subsp. parontospora]|uniref:Uncharacterized protein n=2 Tax=Planomonospora parontospora TaxID=58119 RepID=A0AA37BL22_9ACTN|nr:hypothetical protein [Planomonospora parontospora]GGK87245.1 hypothetical protein GCM10010126_53190 [Planomonospora parontospora]GII11450.1 hypothetical protein Ppa06_52480 [Planomonospora parontospora subsp. parontospora]